MGRNQRIKAEAERRGVKLWEIASRFGVSDSQFSRWLRTEFTEERAAQALRFVEEIAAERRGGQS